MTVIKNFEDLSNWLGKYSRFEDGYVLKIDTNPFVITVGILVSGIHEANTEKEILNFDITPVNVYSCDYTPDFKTSEDQIIEYIDPLDVDEGVGLEIFGPPLLTLIPESFIISENETIKSVFKPWVNEGRIFVQAPMAEIPKSDFWQSEFKKLGYDIVFRFYAGESKPLQQLGSKYSGFFIQLENRVSTSVNGIFIFSCSIKNGEVSTSFQQNDPELDSLWKALAYILACIPNVTISSGNCKFTGAEWKQQLAIL